MPQTGSNIKVNYKVEATLNTAPGASGGETLRITPSPGLSLRKDAIRSAEIRDDGLSTVPRHGSRLVSGSYGGELSVSSWNTVLANVCRSTLTAASTLTQASASLTSIVFGTNYVALVTTTSTGGWVTAGIRVGDVFQITGATATNNNTNAQVWAMTTHTLTVNSGAYTAEATAVTSYSLTRGVKIFNADSVARKSYYVEQYYQDLDLSEVFGGVRFTSFSLTGSPNGMADISVGAMGLSATDLASGASPYYTAPSEYTTSPLAFSDAVIGFDGAKLITATSFSLSLDNGGSTLPVIGSSVGPDVFDGPARLTGSISLLREDLDALGDFADEDELELFVLLQASMAAPKSYFGIYVPRLKLMGLDAPLGSTSGLIETIPWEAGVKVAATGYDGTLLTITTAA